MVHTQKSPKPRKNDLVLTIFHWFPVFLWAVVIFTLSSIEVAEVTKVFFWDFLLKKSAHVIEFAIFFALIFRASRKNWVLSFILSLVYAAGDEFHQSFVPGRTASIFDVGFDLSGANIASYIIWKLKPR